MIALLLLALAPQQVGIDQRVGETLSPGLTFRTVGRR